MATIYSADGTGSSCKFVPSLRRAAQRLHPSNRPALRLARETALAARSDRALAARSDRALAARSDRALAVDL